MLIPYGTDAPVYHIPVGTIGLIATNTAIFCLTLGTNTTPYCLALGDGLHPVQWLTHMFLHANLAHLLGNMIFLWCFGLIVEGKLGWWKFLPLYLAIGMAVGLIIQIAMLDGSTSHALGASAAISGIMVIACLWAPENEIQLVWIIYYRSHFLEARTLVVGGWFVGWDIVYLCFIKSIASGPGAHVLGGVLGAGAGLIFLKQHWVDCEEWDVISVYMTGRKEDDSKLEASQDEAEQNRKRQLIAERVAAGRPQVSVFLKQQNVDAAIRLFLKLREIEPTVAWERLELRMVVAQLLQAGRENEAIPFLQELVERFPHGDPSMRLRLAWAVLRSQQRPAETLRILSQVHVGSLNARQLDFYRRLVGRAQRLQAEGAVELSSG